MSCYLYEYLSPTAGNQKIKTLVCYADSHPGAARFTVNQGVNLRICDYLKYIFDWLKMRLNNQFRIKAVGSENCDEVHLKTCRHPADTSATVCHTWHFQHVTERWENLILPAKHWINEGATWVGMRLRWMVDEDFVMSRVFLTVEAEVMHIFSCEIHPSAT